MTMHVVLGDGEMPAKELIATLDDMYERANKEDDPFWFLVQNKPEPTSTDETLMRWLSENEVYYETIGDGTGTAEIYGEAVKAHTVKRLAPKVRSLMEESPEDEESARLLALFVSDDPDAEEDRWLNDVISTVMDGGFKGYALNDGLVEIDLTAPAAATEEEAEEAPPVKAAAKKTAAKKVAAPVEEQEELPLGEGTDGPYTREELEEMSPTQVREVAANRGIELPPRTRTTTYIDAILGEGKEAADEEVEIDNVVMSSSGTIAGSITLMGGKLQGSAMLVVMYNGTVTSKTITAEEAAALLI